MGYLTNYKLKTVKSETAIQDILMTIPDEEFDDIFYGLERDGRTYDSVKWYQHEKDMKELSEKFPDVVFELSGEGEENGDIWKKYFKNGKMQACHAKIVFDEFNEELLR